MAYLREMKSCFVLDFTCPQDGSIVSGLTVKNLQGLRFGVHAHRDRMRVRLNPGLRGRREEDTRVMMSYSLFHEHLSSSW